MSKTFTRITLLIVLIVTMITIDWFSININKKPVFAVESDGFYKGILYDTYVCEDLYISKVVFKFQSYKCKVDYIEDKPNVNIELMSSKEDVVSKKGEATDYDIYYYGFTELNLEDEESNKYEVMDSLIKEEKTLDNVINDGKFVLKLDNITRIYENDGYTLIKCNELKEELVNKDLYIASNETLDKLDKIGFCN